MTPLRVLIDARMLIGGFSGIARYVTKITDELAQRDDLHVSVLCGNETHEPWSNRRDITVVESSFSRRDRTAARRVQWEEFHLPGIIRAAEVDVYHATWNTGIPSLCPTPSVLTVHDLIPWRNPREHFASSMQIACYRYAMRKSVRRANVIATVSEHTRGEVLATFKVQPTRVIVVPNGVDTSTVPDHVTASSSPPYALYVGGHERRKNVAGVIRAVAEYQRRFDRRFALHLTGSLENLCKEARIACDELETRDNITFLGAVSDEKLMREYAGATMLLMLSEDEGFGIPVIEAMANACPVIAANRTALPEVVGDAGWLVEPNAVNKIADAMHKIATCDSTRKRLIQKGLSRAKQFRWSETSRKLVVAYGRAIHRHAPTGELASSQTQGLTLC